MPSLAVATVPWQSSCRDATDALLLLLLLGGTSHVTRVLLGVEDHPLWIRRGMADQLYCGLRFVAAAAVAAAEDRFLPVRDVGTVWCFLLGSWVG